MITTFLTALLIQAADPQPATIDAPAAAEDLAPATQAAAPAFDREAAISGISTYLNSIETLRARFVQIAPNGQAAEGLLSLARPGRLRFEYDDPSPITVIADGTTVALEDRALETVDRAPLRSTPLWWLLKEEVDLSEDADIVDIVNDFGLIYLTVRDPDGEMDGQIQFVFDAADYSLQEWFVTDALGQITRVALLDQEAGMALSPRLFVIPEPENRRESRRGRR